MSKIEMELEEYDRIVSALYDAALDSSRWAEALEMFRDLFQANFVTLILRSPDETYASAYTARLQLLSTVRRLTELRSRLQRVNPVEHASAHKQAFSELIALEARRRALEAASSGAD